MKYQLCEPDSAASQLTCFCAMGKRMNMLTVVSQSLLEITVKAAHAV